MTSSEERREVAARLRDAWPEAGGMEKVWEVLDPILGTHDVPDTYRAWEQTFNRLADLIDPTCEIAMDQVDDGEWGSHELYEFCSNCGNQNMRDRFTGKPHRYCPNCGARLVVE